MATVLNVPISTVPAEGTTDETTEEFPSLEAITTSNLVGPLAANKQPNQLRKRDLTLRDRINLAVGSINDIGQGGSGSTVKFLPRDGTNAMTAALDMGTNQINSVVDPTAAQDAATKAYVDAADAVLQAQITGLSSDFLPLDGSDPMTGDLDMGTNQIKNVVDPTLAQDAATKSYVDAATGSTGALSAYPTMDNMLINGSFQYNRRGLASYANPTDEKDTLDGWKVFDLDATSSVDPEASIVADGHSVHVDDGSADGNNGYIYQDLCHWHDLEKLKGKTVTLVVGIRQGSTNNGAMIEIADGIGATQTKIVNGSLSSSFQRFAVTRVIDAGATKLEVRLYGANSDEDDNGDCYYDEAIALLGTWTASLPYSEASAKHEEHKADMLIQKAFGGGSGALITPTSAKIRAGIGLSYAREMVAIPTITATGLSITEDGAAYDAGSAGLQTTVVPTRNGATFLAEVAAHAQILADFLLEVT